MSTEPRGINLEFGVFLTDGLGAGKTGLTVTFDAYDNTRTPKKFLADQSASEVGGGVYIATVLAASNTTLSNIYVVFKADPTLVSQQHAPAYVPIRQWVEYQTGDAFARLGEPDGASVSADIAAVQAVVDALQVLVDVATSSAATPTEVQDAIEAAVDELIATFDDPDNPTEIQQAILDALSEAYAAAAAAETESSAATRYANLLAQVQARATPGNVTNAQAAIIGALPVAPDNASAQAAAASAAAAAATGLLIQERTDRLPDSPAATGDAMTLTPGERTSIGGAVWASTTRTLSSFGTLAADTAAAMWNALTAAAWVAGSFGRLVRGLAGITITTQPARQPGTYNYTLVRDAKYTLPPITVDSLPDEAAGYLFSIRDMRTDERIITLAVEPDGLIFTLEFTTPETGRYRYDVKPVDEDGEQLAPIIMGQMTVTETATHAGDTADG